MVYPVLSSNQILREEHHEVFGSKHFELDVDNVDPSKNLVVSGSAAGIFEYCHELNIVYRDLKPVPRSNAALGWDAGWLGG